MAHLQPPLTLEAFEYRRRVDGGVTRPLILAAMDSSGAEWPVVVKLRHPTYGGPACHQEGTSLAAELACAMIGRIIGINVPDYFVVNVSEKFAHAVTDEVTRKTLLKNIGPNFGTALLRGVDIWDPESAGHAGRLDQLEDVIVFDAIVLNCDRTVDKPNMLDSGRQLLCIDHSLAALPSTYSLEFTSYQVANHAAYKALRRSPLLYGRTFTRLISKWEQCVHSATIGQIFRHIPACWEKHQNDRSKMIDFFGNRSSKLSDISRTIVDALS